jgi:hypothetical protein
MFRTGPFRISRIYSMERAGTLINLSFEAKPAPELRSCVKIIFGRVICVSVSSVLLQGVTVSHWIFTVWMESQLRGYIRMLHACKLLVAIRNHERAIDIKICCSQTSLPGASFLRALQQALRLRTFKLLTARRHRQWQPAKAPNPLRVTHAISYHNCLPWLTTLLFAIGPGTGTAFQTS